MLNIEEVRSTILRSLPECSCLSSCYITWPGTGTCQCMEIPLQERNNCFNPHTMNTFIKMNNSSNNGHVTSC